MTQVKEFLAKYGAWLGMALFCVLIVVQHNANVRNSAEADLRLAQIKHENDSLNRVSDSLKKQFKVDTVRLAKWKTKWDTLKAGIDTQWLKPDSVPVPVEVVKTVILTADSTINACKQALLTCDQRVGVERQKTALAEDKAAQYKKKIPSLTSRVLGTLRDASIGYAIGRLQR